jgi:RNA polymerase sigma factor (TIGR02999 family)
MILISVEAVCAMSGDVGEVTVLLNAMKSGDATAADKLLSLVYRELHLLAKGYMRRERPDHTLQPTALINEAYMRMVGHSTDWQNHQHFIGVAANVMRRVLVDHARAHNAGKRGGDLHRVELEEGLAFTIERSIEVIAVDDALSELQTLNPRQAQVVELRYFAELSDEQIAALLNISSRTVQRDWLLAKDWLSQRVR